MAKDDRIDFGVPSNPYPRRRFRLNYISHDDAPASLRACRYHPFHVQESPGYHWPMIGGPRLSIEPVRDWAGVPTDRASAVGYPCHYCGRPAEAIDHVWPKSRGGDDHPNNLVRSCRTCNGIKSSKSLLTARCEGCGTKRDPGDVDTATGRAFYTCRCGQSWTLDWDLQRVRF